MNIFNLIESGANVAITVTPTDLKEFALNIIEQAQMAKAKEETEQYLSPKEASKTLKVSINTLWRWNKEKYLCPIKVGHRSVYKLSEITKLMEG